MTSLSDGWAVDVGAGEAPSLAKPYFYSQCFQPFFPDSWSECLYPAEGDVLSHKSDQATAPRVPNRFPVETG